MLGVQFVKAVTQHKLEHLHLVVLFLKKETVRLLKSQKHKHLSATGIPTQSVLHDTLPTMVGMGITKLGMSSVNHGDVADNL